jgi:hypothetical protein
MHNDTTRRIAAALIDAALAAGLTVSAYEGGDWAIRRSTDRAAILDALASTDHDELVFRNAEGAKVGWALMIWENDCDVLSDYSDNALMESLTAPALAIRDEITGEA